MNYTSCPSSDPHIDSLMLVLGMVIGMVFMLGLMYTFKKL